MTGDGVRGKGLNSTGVAGLTESTEEVLAERDLRTKYQMSAIISTTASPPRTPRRIYIVLLDDFDSSSFFGTATVAGTGAGAVAVVATAVVEGTAGGTGVVAVAGAVVEAT